MNLRHPLDHDHACSCRPRRPHCPQGREPNWTRAEELQLIANGDRGLAAPMTRLGAPTCIRGGLSLAGSMSCSVAWVQSE